MRYKIALSLLLVSILFSCGALKHVAFYQDFNRSVSLPQQNLTSATDTITSPDIPTNIASTLSANNTSTDLLQSAKLQILTLTITTPPSQTFAFLQDVRVFILTDSLPAVEIASKHNIVNTGDTLNMDVDAAELKPYLISTNFKLKFITTNRQASTAAMTINTYLKFRFEANLLAL